MSGRNFRIQKQQCDTCIYGSDSKRDWDIESLEKQIADPYMHGFFNGYRICHSSTSSDKLCCRGFWDRHKDHFALGQVAQRLNLVEFVKGPRHVK